MAFVIAPSRNPIVRAAFAGLRAAERAEKKASKAKPKSEAELKSLAHRALHEKAKGTPGAAKAARELMKALARPKENVVVSESYRRLVAMGACKNCGVQGFSQAAHEPPGGKGIKRDDRGCFPLCTTRAGPKGAIEGCHPQFDRYELFNHAKTHRMAKQWGAETRAEILDAGIWPKKVPKWPKGKK